MARRSHSPAVSRRRIRKCNTLKLEESTDTRSSASDRLLSALGLKKSAMGDLMRIGNSEENSNSDVAVEDRLSKTCSNTDLEELGFLGNGSGGDGSVSDKLKELPKRNSSFPKRLYQKKFSFGSGDDKASLPDKSLFSGKGPENSNSLLRIISERNLVRKISASIHKELSEHRTNIFQNNMDQSFLDNHSIGSSSWDMNPEDSSSPSDDEEKLLEGRDEKGAGEDAEVSIEFTPGSQPVPSLHRKELRVGDLLGEGGFSKVYKLDGISLLSQDEYLKKKQKTQGIQDQNSSGVEAAMRRRLADRPAGSLVLKHLSRKLLKKPKEFHQAAVDMAREAQVLALVNCDYIVKLQAISLGGTCALRSGNFNDFFLVLDRLDDTLEARIKQWLQEGDLVAQKARYPQMIRHAYELASALDYLHERRIVYRDTKPHNVGFLKGDKSHERVQLFDFGMARTLPTDTAPDKTYKMSVAGTARYMSPEMMMGGKYNCKTDVYSWSMTVYEMFSLRKPYGEILRSSQFQEYICGLNKRPFLRDLALPEPVQQVLQDSWCASVSDRLSMREVKQRLKAHCCNSGND